MWWILLPSCAPGSKKQGQSNDTEEEFTYPYAEAEPCGGCDEGDTRVDGIGVGDLDHR